MALDPVRTVVIVPARNEAARIGTCLAALARQAGPTVAVLVVANNCDDGTEAVASNAARGLGLNLQVLQASLPPGAGVGTARRLGCAQAMTTYPRAASLLCTDADGVAAPDWIARNRHHLKSHAAVSGRVLPIADELSVLDGIDVTPAEMEGRYARLVLDFYRRSRCGPRWLAGDHGDAAGASLAMTVAACKAVGGFAELATGEDRDLVRRLKAGGHAVLHAGDVRVTASCRLDGRARDGMAAALRARADRTDYLIDDALPPARHLIEAARRGTLEPWPLQVAPQDRLRARDLAPHIARLERALSMVVAA
ncbi:glycosyltransferase [Loktanella sp. DJP18]|uniref:glycosyltransferase n=1 Tax=Loktanella sp. DJP18 TaxID=3409788 RepID=UPI003BB4AABE